LQTEKAKCFLFLSSAGQLNTVSVPLRRSRITQRTHTCCRLRAAHTNPSANEMNPEDLQFDESACA
jgi:hypothetical protein